MRVLILADVAALAFGSAATAAPVCKTGIPCGNSCISKDKVCHKGAAAPMASKAPAKAAAAAPAKTSNHCKIGGKGAFVKCTTPGATPV